MRREDTIQLASETLTEDELVAITGYKMPSCQRQWLQRNAWEHVLTAAQRPIVGRVYARLKLAGVKPSATNSVAETWSLDLSRVV